MIEAYRAWLYIVGWRPKTSLEAHTRYLVYRGAQIATDIPLNDAALRRSWNP